MKKYIFYDLDGTLVDTRRDIANAANFMLEQMGKPALVQAEIERYVGKGLHYLIAGCLKTEEPKQVEKGAKLYRRHYIPHMMDFSRVYPKAREFLEHYKTAKQAVVTNKPSPFSEDLLRGLGVSDYFEAVVTANSEYPKKPDPAAVRDLLKRAGLSPQHALLIGDSTIDIETARNAGIHVAVLTHGFGRQDELQSGAPDLMAGGFDELLEKVRAKGW